VVDIFLGRRTASVMHRIWLIFSQAVTVVLAALFVLATFQPQWLPGARPVVSVIEAPAMPPPLAAASSHGDAARRAMPSVVNITTSKALPRHPQFNDPWYRFFFGEPGTRPRAQNSLGSGVIASPQGYLLTNNHVIEGADDIEVTLADGRRARATVVGTDPETDLAVLKIDLDALPAIVFGDSDRLSVGDVVLAIGNPFGVGQTVTSGIVSALGRSQLGINTYENFIQTDAAINPGNSGGALVDARGALVGINTAIYSRSGGSMGIGFAIPASTGRMVMESLIRDGRVTRGWIGVEPQDLTPEMAETLGLRVREGVLITGVLQGGPAEAGGVRPGDVIVHINDAPISDRAQLLNAVAALRPSETARLGVQRGERALVADIIVGARPAVRRAR